jgi:hypothetical protein
MFSITAIMTDGYVEEDPLLGLHSRQIWILWIFALWRHLDTPVYVALVDN